MYHHCCLWRLTRIGALHYPAQTPGAGSAFAPGDETMSSTSSPQRVFFVDRYRGLAVLAMIFAHTAVAWLRPGVRGTAYWDVAMRVSGLAAPSFLFLVGVAVALVAARAAARGDDPAEARRALAVRGLEIWALGYGLHLTYWVVDLFWGPWTRVLRVDVLHCIGAGLVVLPWLAWPRRFNWRALLLFLGLGVAGQAVSYVDLVGVLPEGVAGYFTQAAVHGLFPVVPYWAYIALGLFVGGLWVALRSNPRSELRFWIGVAVAVVLLYAASRWVHWLYYHWYLRFPAVSALGRPTRGLVYVLLEKSAWVLGLLVLLRALSWALDRLAWRPVVLLGQTSLFVYSLHLIFIYHLGGKGLRGQLGPGGHLMAAGSLALGMLGLAWGWSRYRRAVWRSLGAALAWVGQRWPSERPSNRQSPGSSSAVCAPVVPPRSPRSPSDR